MYRCILAIISLFFIQQTLVADDVGSGFGVFVRGQDLSSLDSFLQLLKDAEKFLLDPEILPQSTFSLVEKANYKAENYNVPTVDGYVINLVRIINPLIKKHQSNKHDKHHNGHHKNHHNHQHGNKKPIVFIHGLIENANCWLVMGSSNGKPHDWSHFDPANLSEQQLNRIIADDRTSRSFPYLLSNFGYDVWLMNRRNTRWSREVSTKFTKALQPQPLDSMENFQKSLKPLFKLKDIIARNEKLTFRDVQQILTTDFMNRLIDKNARDKYYKYSYDEQARFDLPIVFDFILNKTKQDKLNVLGHSAGGLLTLMLLSTQPEWQSKSK